MINVTNILKFVTLFATIITLSSCSSLISAKNATGFIGGQIISTALQSDDVVVADLRINRNTKQVNTVVEITKSPTTNWNPKPAEVTQNNVPVSVPVQIQEQPVDKSNRLYWLFFTMMLMGMIGAGIIGLIEALSSNPTPVLKPRLKLSKDGTTKNV